MVHDRIQQSARIRVFLAEATDQIGDVENSLTSRFDLRRIIGRGSFHRDSPPAAGVTGPS